jgi:omega-6 fatty acid desaturase (delta-12 desaturase)
LWAAALSVAGGAAYLAAFAGAAFGPLWLAVACALALGPLIAFLFRIAHDCGHECHFASRRLNQIVGRLSNLPAYHPYSLWILFHNWRHHTFTNLKTHDYIWVPLSKAEYDRLGWFGQARERFYRTTLGTGAYYLCAIWFGKMIFPQRAHVGRSRAIYFWDFALVAGFFAVQLGLLTLGAADYADFALRFALAIMVPFLTFNWMVGFTSFLNHTHPGVPWFAKRGEWSFYAGQVHCTVHMGVSTWMIFFVTDFGLHGAHHIEPRIPIWGLDKAEPQIVADAHDELVLEEWSYRRHRDIMQRCKLYDYHGHRWLDFGGNPTTMPTVPQTAAT